LGRKCRQYRSSVFEGAYAPQTRVRGHSIISRPQRRPQRFSALATLVATEPQYVCVAATPGGHLPMEMKSEHATDCRLRQVLESGKKAKTPLIGVVCLLTKGVLICVRPYRPSLGLISSPNPLLSC